MVLQLFVALLGISFMSTLVTQGRRRRVWSVLILLALSALSYFFMNSININEQGTFLYQWLPYNTIKADFSLISTLKMRQMYMALVLILVGSVYLNTIYRSENHSLHFNTLLLLSFISLILLVSSHDFLQLMFASSLFSIINFYMPDVVLAKRKSLIFNFLAEMSLFIGLSIIYGQTGSISFSEINSFFNAGRHRDLVGFLLMFAVGCKSGLFLLNGQYYDLKHATFNRTISIMLLSSPICGAVLLLKLRQFFEASDLASQVMPFWCQISILTALLGVFLKNNIKSKNISFGLMIYAFMLHLIYKDTSLFYNMVPNLLMVLAQTYAIFILMKDQLPEDMDIFDFGCLKQNLKISSAPIILMLLSIISGLSYYMQSAYGKVFSCLYLFSLLVVLKMICSSSDCNQVPTQNIKRTILFYLLPMTIISIWILYYNQAWSNFGAIKIFFVVMILAILSPAEFFRQIGRKKLLRIDILSAIYAVVIIKPLQFFGRILWLAFDVVVLERSIIASISKTSQIIVGIMHKLQEAGKWSCFISIIIGLIIMLIYYWSRVNV